MLKKIYNILFRANQRRVMRLQQQKATVGKIKSLRQQCQDYQDHLRNINNK